MTAFTNWGAGTVRTLSNDDAGRYLVTTVTGTRYELDMDRRLARRMPTNPRALVSRLRRDGDAVPLVEILRCAVDAPLRLCIDLNVPGVVFTARESSIVVRIERVQVGKDR